MKRFRFRLEPVLDFKTQALDVLQNELNTVQAQVAAQERMEEEAYRRISDYDAECTERKMQGMTITEMLEAEACQQVLQRRARLEEDKLARLRQLAEAKRNEVVEARKETHSLEKLKSIRKNEYDTAIFKAEEKSLEDLTAARRALSSAAG